MARIDPIAVRLVAPMLEAETRFFDDHLNEWMATHVGRVVVVKGECLVGFYDDEDKALAGGARRFGLQSFLVRRVAARNANEVSIPALTLGLLRANPDICSSAGGGLTHQAKRLIFLLNSSL